MRCRAPPTPLAGGSGLRPLPSRRRDHGARQSDADERAAPGRERSPAVNSPPLAQIVQWMLEESNNVIAENLARHVAIATGQPASFSGGAAATESVLRALGVTGIQLFDGSGSVAR